MACPRAPRPSISARAAGDRRRGGAARRERDRRGHLAPRPAVGLAQRPGQRRSRAPRHGDLFGAVEGERFDLVVANPPYLPAATDELPSDGAERAWDAGRDGRAFLDRICAAAPEHLRPGGSLLVLHSSLCGTRRTEAALAARGLEVDVVFRHRGALGPIMRERASRLWADGRLAPGSLSEEIVVVRGRRPALRSPRRELHSDDLSMPSRTA